MNKSLEELKLQEKNYLKFANKIRGLLEADNYEGIVLRMINDFIESSLSQYKREIRERVKKKNKDYKNNTVFMTTDGSLSNYHESGYYEKKGYNQAISDVLAELEKLFG